MAAFAVKSLKKRSGETKLWFSFYPKKNAVNLLWMTILN